MIDELIERVLRTKDPAILAGLVPSFEPKKWEKGQTLLRQGETWNRVFFVERGLLRIHLIGREGQDFNKSFWPEGSVLLPLTREMEDRPSLFSLSALEPSVIWHTRVADAREELQRRGLWQDLRAALLEILLMRKLHREHDLLTLDGRERYLKLLRDDPALAKRVPLVQLASYLGMTDVSLSRIRRQLKQQLE